jgi:hypothetical protein
MYATMIINIPYYITWIIVYFVFIAKNKNKIKERITDKVGEDNINNFDTMEEQQKTDMLKKGFNIGTNESMDFILGKIKEMESYKPHINIIFWGVIFYFLFIN